MEKTNPLQQQQQHQREPQQLLPSPDALPGGPVAVSDGVGVHVVVALALSTRPGLPRGPPHGVAEEAVLAELAAEAGAAVGALGANGAGGRGGKARESFDYVEKLTAR